MNESDKSNPMEDSNEKELKRKLAECKLIEETIEDLTTNEKYNEFFDLYAPFWRESFIKSYAHYKATLLRVGPLYLDQEEKRAVEFREDALPMLFMILQKKLFNLQCLWRAGKIELEGIESIYDFEAWEKDILRCPFIEPITREEWKLFKKAVASGNAFDAGPLVNEDDFFSQMMFKWQGYDDFKKYYNQKGESPFPDWYKYYDLHIGTSHLFLLEDLKGPRELELMLIGHDFEHPEQRVLDEHPEIEVPPEVKRKYDTPPPTPVAAPPRLPMMPYEDEDIYEFMEDFEGDNPELLEMARYVIDGYRESRGNNMEIDVENAIQFLLHIKENVPMEACGDWQEVGDSPRDAHRAAPRAPD